MLSLSAGQSATTTITAIVTQEGTISNAASVSGDQTDPDISNNSAAAQIEASEVQLPDLVLTKTDIQDPITLGGEITYVISIANQGLGEATGVTLTDSLPSETNFVSASATQGTCSDAGGVVTCQLGLLNAGQSATSTIVVIAVATGVKSNTATATNNETDLNDTDNSDSEDTAVNPAQQQPQQDDDSPKRRPTPEPTVVPTAIAIETPVPTPVPTAVPPTPVATATPGPVTPQSIEAATVEEAALILQQLPPEEAADVLEEVDLDHAIEILLAVDRDSAGNILDNMSLERLIEIIERADQDTLIALLVEMSQENFFLMPLDLLLANLPGVSVEILARKLTPQPEASLSGPTSQQISDVLVEYLVPRTIADAWAKIIGSPAPLDVVLAKFTKDLTLVRVVVEDFTEPPPNAPPLPPEDILNSIFTIELPDADADDISVAHVTLYVEREWIEENEIHPWTIRFNRLDEEQGQWAPYPAKRVREDNERVFYSVGIPGFSLFAVTERKELREPQFEVTNLSIEPSTPVADEPIIVKANVTNLGRELATFPASLWIDSTIEDSEAFLVPAGGTTELVFTITMPAGSYELRVDRLLQQLEVSPLPALVVTPTPSPTPTPTPTSTPVPTATPTPIALAVVIVESTPTPFVPTPTPLTELTAGVTPPEGDDGGGRGPLFVALAVVVGVLATAMVVGFAGNGFRGPGTGNA